jgi:hypothetical protein
MYERLAGLAVVYGTRGPYNKVITFGTNVLNYVVIEFLITGCF